ncbi:MAG: bifunctional DNA primase/polymerase [Ilumatobacteraceae bacterium]
MPDPGPDMLAAALAAYDAGLCVIPARTDGSKRPLGDWAQWQERRPSRQQVIDWFRDGHPAMGAVCGAVSGDLEMFELEGRFMARFGSAEFMDRAQQFGVELTLKRLLTGLVVVSPSDGRHFICRVDGAVDGNTKLARDANGDTLIETRGEGGFVMLPPSHGTTHPSGRPWMARVGGDFATIVTITADERERLHALARSYDETPAPKPHQPVSGAQKAAHARYSGAAGESWFDMVQQHLAATWTMQALLEHYGWTWCYTDRHGRELLRRPGKDEGVSGSVNEAGRFHPFSSSTPFPSAKADKMSPTYDLLDVIAVYEHQGDRQAAAKAIADTTGIMRTWQQARNDAVADRLRYEPGKAPPNVDPDTGEMRSLPPSADQLFERRPVLRHIRDAARSRLVSPYAVLGCILARVAAFTPPSTCLPPLVGSYAPLSCYVGLHGSSSAGKSSANQCAHDLLPVIPPGVIGPLALGSGEGLVEAFMELTEETDENGKKVRKKRQVHRGALFNLDEGQALGEMSARKGATILSVLRTAWSGGDPGQANASVETRRSLRPGSYHVGLISLWQDKAASILIADVDGGTPQRFVWLPTSDSGATAKGRPAWPGAIDWTPPPAIAVGGIMQPNPLGLAPEIDEEITEARAAALRHEVEEDPLDAHRRLNKLKVAGVLCVLDGRTTITVDDWELAEDILRLSDDVRAWIVAQARRRSAEQVTAEAHKAVVKEQLLEQSAAARAVDRAARAVARAVAKGDGEPVSRRRLTQAIASRDRQHVTVDDAIADAERHAWIVADGDAGWRPGKAKPT